jgi:hypothetical protein
MITIVAGSIFPIFLYCWLGRTWNKFAGFIALTILTLAPYIVSLSAQARAYTLSLLFMSASLYYLDRAVDEESVWWMVLFGGLLYLGTFSEYSFAFFAGSIGIYFLLRVWGQKVSLELIVVWVITQIGGLALYVFHYVTHIKILMNHPSSQSSLDGFLKGAFPWPGDNLLVYMALQTVKQFAYLFASIPLGLVMGCVFLFGLVILWQGGAPEKIKRTRAMVALLVVPFLLTCATSIAHIHPYGRSRHTVFLGIFIAAGVAVALERLTRIRRWTILPAMLLMIPVWYLIAGQDQNNINKERHQLKTMKAGIEYLRKTIPNGSLIFTDFETRLTLNYYLGPRKSHGSGKWEPESEFYTDYHLVALRWGYFTEKEFLEDFMVFRNNYRISPEESVWVVDGGFDIISFESRTENGHRGLPGLKNFGNVLLVFQTPPHYSPAYLTATSSYPK